ncbi:hypothetical protein DIPPA_19841 [Diplonema papillatum]|nr:hypothetical protein DIPPA_19841 [Diplonema papillatum]
MSTPAARPCAGLGQAELASDDVLAAVSEADSRYEESLVGGCSGAAPAEVLACFAPRQRWLKQRPGPVPEAAELHTPKITAYARRMSVPKGRVEDRLLQRRNEYAAKLDVLRRGRDLEELHLLRGPEITSRAKNIRRQDSPSRGQQARATTPFSRLYGKAVQKRAEAPAKHRSQSASEDSDAPADAKPAINPSSRRLKRSTAHLLQWDAEKREKVRQERCLKERTKATEANFTPTLNAMSLRIASNRVSCVEDSLLSRGEAAKHKRLLQSAGVEQPTPSFIRHSNKPAPGGLPPQGAWPAGKIQQPSSSCWEDAAATYQQAQPSEKHDAGQTRHAAGVAAVGRSFQQPRMTSYWSGPNAGEEDAVPSRQQTHPRATQAGQTRRGAGNGMLPPATSCWGDRAATDLEDDMIPCHQLSQWVAEGQDSIAGRADTGCPELSEFVAETSAFSATRRWSSPQDDLRAFANEESADEDDTMACQPSRLENGQQQQTAWARGSGKQPPMSSVWDEGNAEEEDETTYQQKRQLRRTEGGHRQQTAWAASNSGRNKPPASTYDGDDNSNACWPRAEKLRPGQDGATLASDWSFDLEECAPDACDTEADGRGLVSGGGSHSRSPVGFSAVCYPSVRASTAEDTEDELEAREDELPLHKEMRLVSQEGGCVGELEDWDASGFSREGEGQPMVGDVNDSQRWFVNGQEQGDANWSNDDEEGFYGESEAPAAPAGARAAARERESGRCSPGASWDGAVGDQARGRRIGVVQGSALSGRCPSGGSGDAAVSDQRRERWDGGARESAESGRCSPAGSGGAAVGDQRRERRRTWEAFILRQRKAAKGAPNASGIASNLSRNDDPDLPLFTPRINKPTTPRSHSQHSVSDRTVWDRLVDGAQSMTYRKERMRQTVLAQEEAHIAGERVSLGPFTKLLAELRSQKEGNSVRYLSPTGHIRSRATRDWVEKEHGSTTFKPNVSTASAKLDAMSARELLHAHQHASSPPAAPRPGRNASPKSVRDPRVVSAVSASAEPPGGKNNRCADRVSLMQVRHSKAEKKLQEKVAEKNRREEVLLESMRAPRAGSPGPVAAAETFEKQQRWCARRENRLASFRRELKDRELETCTFSPTIHAAPAPAPANSSLCTSPRGRPASPVTPLRTITNSSYATRHQARKLGSQRAPSEQTVVLDLDEHSD